MTPEKKPHYSGHRARLKERFKSGPSVFPDYELLELLLGYVIPRKDVKPIAKDILAKTNSIAEVLSTDISDIAGVGKETELFISALREFYDRCQIVKVKALPKISGAADVYEYLKFGIAMGDKECFALLYLNSKNAVISHEILAKGTVNSTPVFPREVAEAAMNAKAVGVIAVHNHPSGDTTPSKEDIDITKRLKEGLALLNITLIDHVIVTKNSYVSLSKICHF